MQANKFATLQRINLLSSEIIGLYHQASFKIGLSDSVCRILYALYTAGGSCLLSDIYKDFGISKQTVNSALRKLEEQDIIKLEQHYGKAKKVFLTELGKQKADATISKMVAAEIGAFASWTEEEIATYIHLTQKYADTFRAQVKQL